MEQVAHWIGFLVLIVLALQTTAITFIWAIGTKLAASFQWSTWVVGAIALLLWYAAFKAAPFTLSFP